ncbi:MAG: hypothetical protein IPO08_23675 [Xanthomonadales bacterium]|nr:hypothetical protein [Xanthomonadales bacterium]
MDINVWAGHTVIGVPLTCVTWSEARVVIEQVIINRGLEPDEVLACEAAWRSEQLKRDEIARLDAQSLPVEEKLEQLAEFLKRFHDLIGPAALIPVEQLHESAEEPETLLDLRVSELEERVSVLEAALRSAINFRRRRRPARCRRFVVFVDWSMAWSRRKTLESLRPSMAKINRWNRRENS